MCGIIDSPDIIADVDFWNKIVDNPIGIEKMKKKIEYLMSEFGTGKPCNRFDVGNCIEFIINELICSSNFKTVEMPNAKRVDIDVENYKQLSIKYSSCGNITLHNSNGCINKDVVIHDTLLLTNDHLLLLSVDMIKKCGIDISNFIQNKGDSLQLKRSILKQLKLRLYPYILHININIDKKTCKNRLCSKVFYTHFLEEFNKQN